MILKYLVDKVDRLDVTDCDIAEDALTFKEYLSKIERV